MEDEKLKKIIKENYTLRYDIKNMLETENIKKIIDIKEEKKMSRFKLLPALGLLFCLFFIGNGIALALSYPNIYSKVYEFFVVPESDKIDSIIIEGTEEKVDTSGIKSTLGYKVQLEDSMIETLTRQNDHDIYNLSDMYKLEIYFTEKTMYEVLNIKSINDTILVPATEYYETIGQLIKTKNINKEEIDNYIVNDNKAKSIETILKDEVYTYGDGSKASIIKEYTFVEVKNKMLVIEETYPFDSEIYEGWKSSVREELKSLEIYEEKNGKEVTIMKDIFGLDSDDQYYYED